MASSKEGGSGKGPKPAKPKPNSLPQFSISDMPPAENHENKLVSVINEGGEVLSLAYSNGDVWLQIAISGELAVPNPDVPSAQAAPVPPAAPSPEAAPQSVPPSAPAQVEQPPVQPPSTPAQSPASVVTPTYAPAQAPAPETPAGTVVPPVVPPSAETGGAT